MKKYVIAGVTALMAVFSAHAVLLDWTVDSVSYDSGSVEFSDVDTIAIYYSDSADWTLASSHYTDKTTALTDSGFVQQRAKPGSTTPFWGPTAASGTVDATGKTGYFYIVVFSGDTYFQSGGMTNSGDSAAFFTQDGPTPPPVNVWNPASQLQGNATWSSTGVVPEPTSFALFALGVAAIGLRRRVKK